MFYLKIKKDDPFHNMNEANIFYHGDTTSIVLV